MVSDDDGVFIKGAFRGGETCGINVRQYKNMLSGNALHQPRVVIIALSQAGSWRLRRLPVLSKAI